MTLYVSPSQMRSSGCARGGPSWAGGGRPRRARPFALIKVDAVNFEATGKTRDRMWFDAPHAHLPHPPHPHGSEQGRDVRARARPRVAHRLGQRGLIVAAPRTGKTMLLQAIANAITTNHPEVYLIVLLIDERPEEVTDMQRSVKGEVQASTSRRTAHPARAGGRDGTWRKLSASWSLAARGDPLDSITRMARAYNTVTPLSGRVLPAASTPTHSEAQALLGAARNIEEGGSLTIIATALVDTGSRMDDVIFEEFKGTGNMEIHLDRKLVDKRTFPAIDINKSGTRKEELLTEAPSSSTGCGFCARFSTRATVEAMELLIGKLGEYENNEAFLKDCPAVDNIKARGGAAAPCLFPCKHPPLVLRSDLPVANLRRATHRPLGGHLPLPFVVEERPPGGDCFLGHCEGAWKLGVGMTSFAWNVALLSQALLLCVAVRAHFGIGSKSL